MENEKSEIQQLRKEAEADTDPRVDLAVERTEMAWKRTHLHVADQLKLQLYICGCCLDYCS